MATKTARPVSQIFWREGREGSSGVLFTDPHTPNNEHIVNGGNQWPRKKIIKAAAEALGVQPSQINAVKMTYEFMVVDE